MAEYIRSNIYCSFILIGDDVEKSIVETVTPKYNDYMLKRFVSC